MKTKNRKSALTHLLDVPDLIEVVTDWDAYIRLEMPTSSLWYAITQSVLGVPQLVDRPAGRWRNKVLAQNIAKLFDRAGMPPMSPHKFRHGHAVYGLKNAADVGDLKAVSMNLMHASLGVTDEVYAILSDQDVGARIATIGKTNDVGTANKATLAEELRRLAAQLETE